MIRCSECQNFKKFSFPNKTFYYCYLEKKRKGCGNMEVCRLFDRVPKAHPRWCPLWKEKKNAEPREH